jgi:hypothetical protein
MTIGIDCHTVIINSDPKLTLDQNQNSHTIRTFLKVRLFSSSVGGRRRRRRKYYIMCMTNDKITYPNYVGNAM